METHQKTNLLEEIKRLERELYLKRSKLALEGEEVYSSDSEKINLEEWKKIFRKLISAIGKNSIGGNSVEDIKVERNR